MELFDNQLNLEIIESLLNDELKQALDYLEEPGAFIYQNKIVIADMGAESPNRRSLCYDEKARVNRKKNAPISSAVEECEKHHVALVNEDLYLYMQSLKTLDQKTSSWILTDSSMREKGGALFGDHRYGRTFFYHNGADSYYSARGFRAYIILNKK